MTVTLELPPETEAALKAQAQARGLSIERWLLEPANSMYNPDRSLTCRRPTPRSGCGSSALGPKAMIARHPYSPMNSPALLCLEL
jgi:hypothetical protein